MSTILIVVPFYNEADRFVPIYWREIILGSPKVSWVFVNDGSSDCTGELLASFCADMSITLLTLENNQGKSNAIRLGISELLKVNKDLLYVGFLDGDGAFISQDIFNLLSLVDNEDTPNNFGKWDVVISSRVALAGRQIVRKMWRHYLGRVIATFITRGWNGAPYDTQSGFKLFKVSAELDEALISPFKTKWFLDIELFSRLAIISKRQLKIWEVPLNAWTDVEGSNISFRQFSSILREIQIARGQVKQFIRLN